jgi:hypothetical protein
MVVEIHKPRHDEPAPGVHETGARILPLQPRDRAQRQYQPVVPCGYPAAGYEGPLGVPRQDGPAADYDHLRLPPYPENLKNIFGNLAFCNNFACVMGLPVVK